MVESAFNAVFNQKVLIRIVSALAIMGIVNIATISDGFATLKFADKVSFIPYLLYLLCIVLILSIIDKVVKFNCDIYALAVSAFAYCCYMSIKYRNLFFSIGLLFVISIIGYYFLKDDKFKLSERNISLKLAAILVTAAAAFLAVYIGVVTTLRYLNYSTSTYDLGIFSQMYYYMKETLVPYTTCERGKLLSHFAVHLSPVFYLLLPGYFIFPSPVYLQIMQALVVASSVIPLFLLARRNQLSYKVTAVICISFCFHPALAGGCFYDIHENMFLTPFLLWMFYFLDGKQWNLVYLFAFFTCLVKEDAPIYIASVAAYLIFSKKEIRRGIILLTGSVIYFALAIMYINNFGDGAMIGRYDNFIGDSDLGLLNVIKVIISNPGYLIYEVFNQEKVLYMLIMLLPVAFLPLLNRDLPQMLMLIPFLLINLVSDYPYQHSIVFQYNFGTLAFLYYLVIKNLPGLGFKFKKYGLPFMAAASVLLFISQIGIYADNITNYIRNHEKYSRISQALEAIPEDASVRASGYFVPKLSSRKVLYDIQYSFEVEEAVNADYIAIDMRPGLEGYAENVANEYKARGYKVVDYEENLYCILKKE